MGSASRGFSVGVSSTSSPKVCQVIAESSEMNVFVVDDDRQLQKVIQVSDAWARGSQDPHIWGAAAEAKAQTLPGRETESRGCIHPPNHGGCGSVSDAVRGDRGHSEGAVP